MHFLPPRRCQPTPLSSSLFSLHFVENDSHPGRFMGSLDSHVPATPQILIDFFSLDKTAQKKLRSAAPECVHVSMRLLHWRGNICSAGGSNR